MDGKCISILVHYLSSKLVCYYSMKVWKEERKKEGTTKKVKVQRKIFNGATKIFWHSHSIFLQVQQKIFHPYIPELRHSYL